MQRAANRVRVSAQLIDAKTDTHLWAESYDRPLDDVFAIQSDIAKAIAGQLQAKLSPKTKSAIEERPTKDLAAYDLYVRAKLLMMNGRCSTRENLFEAARLLDQAIARDPDFFLAYCLIAEAHSRLYWIFDHTPARRDLADRAVKAALRLRPEAGEAHLERARYLYMCNLDYDNARAELALAQRTLPNNAQVFALMGHIDWSPGPLERVGCATMKKPWSSIHATYLLSGSSRSTTILCAVLLSRPPLWTAPSLWPPKMLILRAFRAWLDLQWRADPKPLHKIFEA